MAFYGADVSQLRELAKAADKAATLLSTRVTSLQGQIMAAPWKGADGERFRQDWNGRHRPSLDRVVNSLKTNAKLLLQNADEQEKSSAASTGSTKMTFLEKLQVQWENYKTWLAEKAAEAEARAEHREQLENQLGTMADASPKEQAEWWASLSEEDRQYLIEGEGENGPFAAELMKMDGGIPESAQQQAREHLQELARADIPVNRETSTASIEGRVAWVHGGAEVGVEVVENADGSATMKVHGNLGIGVNDPSGTAGVTLNGEVSRQYTFDSMEDALAARDQMYRDLPPDSLGDAKDVVENPPDYILDTIENAADDNDTSGHSDSVKGSVELAVEGKSGTGTASGEAALNLAYERNLTDGTSTASAEVSASGKLDLNGDVFQADGKAGLQVKMDADNNISSVSVSMEGTVARGVSGGVDTPGATSETTVTGGAQGTVKIDVPYTPENQPIIDSYMRNVALGNDAAASEDAARLYEAGSATVQVNAVATATSQAGFDVRAAEVEVKTQSQISTNVSTYHKVPNDTELQRIEQN
ncbi:hypothetical protein V1639_15465 [Pseudarthrobacter sp. J75]|uniref:hypothetical protein n=1 Tax=unclassified Pseudarthrobacter TaxID=2647000 RepID=UPI002E813C33|nr:MULTISPECIES: hypothetical protein [unclassified Pseudarthrobacter]MEE2524140.1 hypothetical protein [Pseudarthrobacter sp. J47]MEE2530419.1 hypothetical protein [Pseudarthrobacter sp. J75]